MASAGDAAGARAALATLAPFWDRAVRARTPEETSRTSGFFGKALRVADAAADAQGATALLRPFRIENLTDAHVNSFGKIAGRYGQRWTAELLQTWFGGDQPRARGAGQGSRGSGVARRQRPHPEVRLASKDFGTLEMQADDPAIFAFRFAFLPNPHGGNDRAMSLGGGSGLPWRDSNHR